MRAKIREDTKTVTARDAYLGARVAPAEARHSASGIGTVRYPACEGAIPKNTARPGAITNPLRVGACLPI